MVSAALTFALAGLAAASPLSVRDYSPPTSHSKGFRLVLNVTDRSRDFKDMPVHGMQLTGVHVGAGINAPVPDAHGAVFYETGPVGPEYANNTLQLAIGGSTPYGLEMSATAGDDGHTYGLDIRGGDHGTPDFALSGGPKYQGCPALFAPRVGTFVVCDLGFGAPAHPKQVLEFVEGPRTGWYEPPANVPANCVPVKLLAECAPLDLSGATYPHDAVWDSPCYQNVSAVVDWNQYPGLCF